MAKIIVTYNEVADLNHILEEKGVNSKVHLHDLCGSQSFTIEPLISNNDFEQLEAIRNLIIRYFNDKGMELRFAENKMDFVINQ